ncbi:MAG TPA: hypothetical protein PKZ76_08520 [Xanthomonadaceae bacterium]|nr:hypothetical protein [Xanthomonadaceae bacterium]
MQRNRHLLALLAALLAMVLTVLSATTVHGTTSTAPLVQADGDADGYVGPDDWEPPLPAMAY